MNKKTNRLWGFLNGEPYMGNLPASADVQDARGDEAPWFSKVFYQDARGFTRVALENPPYRTFEEMPPEKILDTRDVARRAKCSRATVHRHVEAGRLKTHTRGSTPHDFFYLKRDVENWLSHVVFRRVNLSKKEEQVKTPARSNARGRKSKDKK